MLHNNWNCFGKFIIFRIFAPKFHIDWDFGFRIWNYGPLYSKNLHIYFFTFSVILHEFRFHNSKYTF